MNTYQNLRLYEWIAIGKESGKIREARMVVLTSAVPNSRPGVGRS